MRSRVEGLWRQWEAERVRMLEVQRRMRAFDGDHAPLNAEMELCLHRMYGLEDQILRLPIDKADAGRLLRLALHARRMEAAEGEDLGPNWRLVERAAEALGA